MQRTTITLDDGLADQLEAHMAETGAQSRSEAIRDLLRRALNARVEAPEGAACFGILSCAVDPSVRDLGRRLPQDRLARHDQTVAALSVPIDHSHAIEITVMRGAARAISGYAEALFLERGVMHGTLGLIPVAWETHHHSHDGGHGVGHGVETGGQDPHRHEAALPVAPHALGSDAQGQGAGHSHTHLRVLSGFPKKG